MDVFHPNDTFQFDKLYLTHPNNITGGAYLTRYSYNDSKLPLYIQTTKTHSKQGIVITGKKAHIDLLLTSSDQDAEFIEWITNLEKRSIDLLYEKRHLWFTQELDRTDIENSFTSPIRAYKTGSYLIRVNLESNRHLPHIQPFSCKIFNEKKQVAPVDYIKAEQSIISIIEFQGIKFTSRNFQIELILRQVLVIPDLPLFETCVIDAVRNDCVQKPTELTPTPQIPPAPAPVPATQFIEEQEEKQIEEHLGINISNEPEEVITPLKHFECMEVDIDFKNIPDTIDTNEPEFQIIPSSDESKSTVTSSHSIPISKQSATIKLKKHKDVIYEMYKIAKQKALEARKVAIRTYLEAKEIKAAYLLDDLDDLHSDSSEDEFET